MIKSVHYRSQSSSPKLAENCQKKPYFGSWVKWSSFRLVMLGVQPIGNGISISSSSVNKNSIIFAKILAIDGQILISENDACYEFVDSCWYHFVGTIFYILNPVGYNKIFQSQFLVKKYGVPGGNLFLFKPSSTCRSLI